MADLCSLQVLVNRQQTFFLHQKVLTKYSEKLKKIIKQEKKRTQIRSSGIEIDDFPGGPDGFELVSRFCYNNGATTITVSNVSLLHCCAVFLGMTEKMSASNLLHQTEAFLQQMFYWSWNDILTCLKSLEPFFSFADSCGLVEKLVCLLLAKIAQNSDINQLIASSSSASSSPENSSRFRYSPAATKFWWFEDLTLLSPKTIEYFAKSLGSFAGENNSIVLTRFLLHYLQKSASRHNNIKSRAPQYNGLAETAVSGVILTAKTSFSCRSLFWVLRVVSGFGLSRNCRAGLEKLIGGVLDQATLDDLLVSGRDGAGVYDVNLVMRLVRQFVQSDRGITVEKMKSVGRLMDKYLREIAPDQNLKITKFLGVAESLPDCARDCFDEVYRAIDIYLESHPALSLEERSRLCRCLNYEKLSLECCKDLAKNPKIPPRIAVQALASQHSSHVQSSAHVLFVNDHGWNSISKSRSPLIALEKTSSFDHDCYETFGDESVDIRQNIQRMQQRVVELEKVCREMKGQMSRMRKGSLIVNAAAVAHSKALPRMC